MSGDDPGSAGGFVVSFAAGSRIAGYRLEERIGQGASRRTNFSETVTFSFRIGNDAYNWEWTSCSKDTEAADGIGLPGHHGCGAERVLSSAPYLG